MNYSVSLLYIIHMFASINCENIEKLPNNLKDSKYKTQALVFVACARNLNLELGVSFHGLPAHYQGFKGQFPYVDGQLDFRFMDYDQQTNQVALAVETCLQEQQRRMLCILGVSGCGKV